MTVNPGRDTRTMRKSGPPPQRRRGVIAGLITAAVFALGCSIGGDIIAYEMPEGSARYTYQTETNGVTTAWEYNSAKPTGQDAPADQPCMDTLMSGVEGQCRPEPLIFLRYDMRLGLDNTARADSLHTITVTGYYQERLSTPPTVSSMQVEVSFDNGQTWRAVPTMLAGKNVYTANVKHPKRDRASGTVGLRVSAFDDQGNTVKQTIPVAYHLS